MDIDRFRASPAGELEPIHGHDAYLQRDYSHYAFVPRPAPTTITLSQSTYNSVTKAALALGRLDFAVRRLPDPRLLIRPVLRREAQSTSELEGTYAPLDEVLAADFIDEARRSAELREVMNYVVAAERAFEMIKTLPICLRVLCELQAILIKDTRGEMYDSGQLRQRQVFIGERELGIEESRFVPVPEGAMLEDGVSDWEPWIKFFSTAVEAQAQDMVERIEQLLTVREELLRTAREHTIRGFAVDIIEDLIGYSSITPSTAAKRHNVQYKTANDAIKRLEKLGILREITGAGYGRIYVSPRVTEIVLRP